MGTVASNSASRRHVSPAACFFLVPPASDSYFKREWGYDTSHYLAPDAELGFPEGNLSPHSQS
jgi:hypothetical protein